jgi:uncharacterized repeat protein (TIGR01451 family)
MSRFIKNTALRTCTRSALFMVMGFVMLPWGHAQVAASRPTVSVQATPKQAVTVKLEQFKVVSGPGGQEALADASTVKPGDIVEYQATYRNNDVKPVTGLQATLPIPEGTEYLPKTARPGADLVKAATREGLYAPEPLQRQVRVNGKLQTEPVPYGQYRSLQWALGQLPPGGEFQVKARVQIERYTPPQAGVISAVPARSTQQIADLAKNK